MFVTNHLLAGAVIGSRTRRPLVAFVTGVASHFALDAVPHWGVRDDPDTFLRVARRDGFAGLAALAVLALTAPADRRRATLAGALGAALPDLDKPFRLLFGRSPWPGPVNRFHSAIQTESPGLLSRELVTAAALAGTLALGTARSRRRPGDGGRR